MKTAACFFIALAIACAGYQYSRKIEIRVKKIEKILLFLSQIKTEIQFSADNIQRIMASLSDSEELSSLGFISACSKKLKEGADFSSAWNSAVGDRSNIYALKKDDISLLYSFGASLGKTDTSGQIGNCELHEKLFKERHKNAVEEQRKLCRPIRITGFLAGVAVMIIFM